MRARLFCPVGDVQLDHEFTTEATLGRGPKNSVVLGADLLSNRHLRIDWNPHDRCYVLQDLDSSNGTRLDGAVVDGPQRLGHLHVITLAESFELVFQDLDRCAERHRNVGTASAATDVRAATRQATPHADMDGPVPEKTLAEPLPLPLPDILRKAEQQAAGEREVEHTILERLPMLVPQFLRKKEDPAHFSTRELSPVGGPQLTAADPPAPSQPSPAPSPQPPKGRPMPPAPRTTEEWHGSIDEIIERGHPGAPAAGTATDLPAGGRLLLEVDAEDGPVRFPLTEGQHVIGRGIDANLRVPSAQISRRHARLTVAGGTVRIKDQGSSNHTYVDGVRTDDEVEVEPAQSLCFGGLTARLISAEESKG